MIAGADVLEERLHAGGRVHGHHADELHLRHPGHPDRRLLPQRLADDLQGPPVLRHHDRRRSSRCSSPPAPTRARCTSSRASAATSRRSSPTTRVAVVSVTGSAETAKTHPGARGVRPVQFEGGGCNWSWVDDGFSDDGAATRSPCGSPTRSSASARTSARRSTASRRARRRSIASSRCVVAEMKTWKRVDPRVAPAGETKIVSPLMVHKASTVQQHPGRREGGRREGAARGREGRPEATTRDHAEVAAPVVLGRVTPETRVARRLGRQGAGTIALATTEFFMPILVTMEMASFDDFVRFCLEDEPARSRDEPLDARRREARRARGGRSAACSRRTTAPTARSSGRSSARAASARAATPASATPTTTIAMFCRQAEGPTLRAVRATRRRQKRPLTPAAPTPIHG